MSENDFMGKSISYTFPHIFLKGITLFATENSVSRLTGLCILDITFLKLLALVSVYSKFYSICSYIAILYALKMIHQSTQTREQGLLKSTCSYRI